MTDLQLNNMLDVVVFVLCIGKFYYGHWTDFGSMTRLGLLLGSAWLVADDFDILNLIPGDYSHYSLIRTGTFKLTIIIGLVLDLVRCFVVPYSHKKYFQLTSWAKAMIDLDNLERNLNKPNSPVMTAKVEAKRILDTASVEASKALALAKVDADNLMLVATEAATKLLQTAKKKSDDLLQVAQTAAETIAVKDASITNITNVIVEKEKE